MDNQNKPRVEDTHQALHRHFIELAQSNAGLDPAAKTYSASFATGYIVYVAAYVQCHCLLKFNDDSLVIMFDGKGIGWGVGGTGSMAGQASFNVDPNILKTYTKVNFQASAVGVGVGGFQITWYNDGTYIGHGEFVGGGVQLGAPCGGWGSFSV